MKVVTKDRNKLNHYLRLAKRSYDDVKLKSLKNNIKGTWNILNQLQIINRTKRPKKLPSIPLWIPLTKIFLIRV